MRTQHGYPRPPAYLYPLHFTPTLTSHTSPNPRSNRISYGYHDLSFLIIVVVVIPLLAVCTQIPGSLHEWMNDQRSA